MTNQWQVARDEARWVEREARRLAHEADERDAAKDDALDDKPLPSGRHEAYKPPQMRLKGKHPSDYSYTRPKGYFF
ncbi:hypothetical protein [Mobilicoccus massiliensis]|uniref:hypothetical protein n=1 Tax=Mobilicoccus massiliensis TaxID=1522310 RepID=UPI00114309AF|nr:hypothetical protein [Mobilicoccus massiliensis]